jgi:hypothetical protein
MKGVIIVNIQKMNKLDTNWISIIEKVEIHPTFNEMKKDPSGLAAKGVFGVWHPMTPSGLEPPTSTLSKWLGTYALSD